MNYHSLHFRNHGTAQAVKELLGESGLPLQNLAIRDTPYTVNFHTDNELDEATQAQILEKVKPLSSKFNEEPPFFTDLVIADYTHAMQNLSVSSTETFKLSAQSSKTIERLEAEAARQGLTFKFDEEGNVWTLVPLELQPLEVDEAEELPRHPMGNAEAESEIAAINYEERRQAGGSPPDEDYYD